MLLSIIIPVYNVQNYLERCVKSVIEQYEDKIEIILIDDGSTDSSSLICDSFLYNNKNIKVIHKENEGLSSARNAGIDIANGEYIAFLDSDDLFEKSFIKDILKYINEYNPDIISFDCCFEKKENVYKPKGSKNIKIYDRLLYLKNIINNTFSCQICFRVFKKRLFDNIRFPNCYYEDIRTLWKLISVSNKIIYIDYTYYIYNITNQKSITKKNDLKSMKDMKDSVDIMINGIYNEFTKSGLIDEDIKRELLYYKLNIYIYIIYKLKYLKSDFSGIKNDLKDYINKCKVNLWKYRKYDYLKLLVCKILIYFNLL